MYVIVWAYAHTHMCYIVDIFELFGLILKNKNQTLENMPNAKQVAHLCSNTFIQR